MELREQSGFMVWGLRVLEGFRGVELRVLVWGFRDLRFEVWGSRASGLHRVEGLFQGCLGFNVRVFLSTACRFNVFCGYAALDVLQAFR